MRRLILFAKRPRAGQVKTRLAPPLAPAEAVELYRAFLSDQLRFLLSFPCDHQLELCRDEPWPLDTDERVRRTLQGDGDLGARMERCFARSFREGASAVVILAVDSPTVPASIVHAAFDALDSGATAALAPADDGGYVLIGLTRSVPEFFRDLPWGGPEVLRITKARARESDLPLALLAPWFDVDDATDLRRLRAELRSDAASARAPATARALCRLGRRLDADPDAVI